MADDKQQYVLTEEDKKILAEAHKNKDNPDHPANPQNPKHHHFMKGLGGVANRLGNATIFGVGASAGADALNGLIGSI